MEIENQAEFKRTPLENRKGQDEDRYHHADQAQFPPKGLHPDRAAEEPRDAGVDRSRLHPVDIPPPAPRARTREEILHALDDFGGRIVSLAEGDYGDWMRRANLYWHRLAEALSIADRQTQRMLLELHRIIQYNPNFLIHSTRKKVIDQVLAIREHLGGRGDLDPHDYGVSTVGKKLEDGAPAYSERFANPEPVEVGPAVANGSDRGFIGKG